MRANTAFVVLCNTPVVFFSKQERSDGGKKKSRCEVFAGQSDHVNFFSS